MSRLNDLLRQVANTDPQLAKDLRRETDALADRRAFGLNFERHTPEAVELPGRPVRKNDKVRILPERGKMPKNEDQRLYRVARVYPEDGDRWADVVAVDNPDDASSVIVDDLVVVAEFRDPIYPGLVSTGKVERGGDKPFHTVINSENYHALQALLFTHRGKIDAIYIDPPYNTGARDWKYNNDYVESDDHYRHSKWLAMMERRLALAKELLNPANAVLIVTIDEKEYLRLGLLLEQVFDNARIQMVSSNINATGVIRATEFTRTNEFVYIATFGDARIEPEMDNSSTQELLWNLLQRREDSSRRHGPIKRLDQFYPIFVNRDTGRIESIGRSLQLDESRHEVDTPTGCDAVFPMRPDGTEMVWGLTPASLQKLLEKGYVKVTRSRGKFSIYYLTSGKIRDLENGNAEVVGHRSDGSVIAVSRAGRAVMPTSQWDRQSHNSQSHGTKLISRLIPNRKFPFPKSLYAVEDVLRFFVKTNKSAVVLDFFAGSGTTAHAVMRLNRQDGGTRQSISVTNNELSAEEQKDFRSRGLRPTDPEWEQHGIFRHVTMPRITAAITGSTPDGSPVRGDYKFIDEFPLSQGLEENVAFFTLTYESAMRVASNREFAKIAPFLWLRSGSRGRVIDDISTGWDVADTYGVIANLDLADPFIKAVEIQEGLTHVFIVTDEDRLFEAMVRQLSEHIEPVRLYSAYLRNFEIEAGRAAR